MRKRYYAAIVRTKSFTREHNRSRKWEENAIEEETYPVQLSTINDWDDEETIKRKIAHQLGNRVHCTGVQINNRIMLEYSFNYQEINPTEYRSLGRKSY